jgi:hypothetical protein
MTQVRAGRKVLLPNGELPVAETSQFVSVCGAPVMIQDENVKEASFKKVNCKSTRVRARVRNTSRHLQCRHGQSRSSWGEDGPGDIGEGCHCALRPQTPGPAR